jgi:hypothetical protein
MFSKDRCLTVLGPLTKEAEAHIAAIRRASERIAKLTREKNGLPSNAPASATQIEPVSGGLGSDSGD